MDRAPRMINKLKTKDKFSQTNLSVRGQSFLNIDDLLTEAFKEWYRNVDATISSSELVNIRQFFPDTEVFDNVYSQDSYWLKWFVHDYLKVILANKGIDNCDVNSYVYLFDFPGLCDYLKGRNVYLNSTLPQVYCGYKRNKHFQFHILRELKFWRSLQNGQPQNYDPGLYYQFLDSQCIPMCAILTNDRVVAQVGINIDINHHCPDIARLIDSPLFQKLLLTVEMFSSESIVEKLKCRIVSISAMVYNLTRWSQSKMTTTDLIVNLAASLSVCVPISIMTETLRRLFVPQAQGGEVSISLLIKAFFLSLFVLIVGKLPGKHTIDEFVNRVHKIPHAIESLRKFWQQIDPITQCATTYIESELLGYDVLQENAVIEEVQQWADKVAEYSDLYKKRQIAKDKETMLEAGRLHVTGVRLLAKCQRLHYGRENSDLIKSLLATTYKISDIAIRSGADHSKPRREPLIIWFCGKSGVGKSTLTYPFICDMMKSEGPVPDNWVQKIYARAPECEFFDGDPTDWMVYDDGFQIRDSIANPSPELFEIIRLGNMFPYMYHKASIEEKGNSFADVKGIVISSNIEKIQGESLNCLDAVARRIHYAYRVQLKPEFRKYYIDTNNKRSYKLDKSKITEPTMGIYSFQPFDAASGKDVGEPLSYEQVVTQCSLMLHRLGEEFVSYEQWLEEYRQKSFRETLKCQVGSAYSQEVYNFLRKVRSGEYLDVRDLLIWEYINFSGRFERIKADFPDIDFDAISRLINRTDVSVFQNSSSPQFPEEAWEKFYEELDHCKFLTQTKRRRDKVVIETMISPHHEFVEPFNGINPFQMLFLNWMQENYKYYTTGEYSVGNIFSATRNDWSKSVRALWKNPIRSFAAGTIYQWKALAALPYNMMNLINLKYGKFIFDESYYLWRVGKAFSDEEIRWPGGSCVLRTSYPYMQSGAIVEELADDEVTSVKVRIQLFKMRCKRLMRDSWAYTCSNLPNLLLYTLGALSASYALYNIFKYKDEEVDEQTAVCAQSLDGSGSAKSQPRPRARVQHDSSGPSGQRHVARARVQAKDVNGLDKLDNVDRNLKENVNSVDCDMLKENVDFRKQSLNAIDVDLRPSWAKAQGNTVSMDKQMYSILDSRVYANTLVAYISKRGTDAVHRRIGHVIALRGSLFLMNYHFVLVMKLYPDCDVILRQSNIVYHRCTTTELIENYVRVGDRDLVVFRMQRKGIAFGDLVKHIQTKGMSYSHNVQTVMLARSRLSGFAVTPNPLTSTDARLVTSRQSIELDLRGNVTEIVNAESWMYTGATYDGDCGALLLINNNRVPAKIVGVHNAFDAYGCIAIAVPLYREEVEEAMMYFEPKLQYGWHEDFPLEVELLQFDQGENFNVVRAEPGSIPTNSKSRLAKSPIFERFIPTLTKPGYLRPFEKDGQVIDPARLARAKWGYHLPVQNEGLARRATNAVVQVFMRNHRPLVERYCYPLSTEEAIIGVEGVEGLASINKVSSPGYPYVFDKIPGKGKTGYFGQYEFDLNLPGAKQVIREVTQMEVDILNNRRPFVVWIDTLKDARIPIEKAEKGKTRIFSAGPMSYVILYRKYFLPPISHCMWNRIDNHIALGINPTSPEWHRLALKLKSKGKHCVAGDYACFDGKAPTEGYLSALEFYKAWYMEHWDLVVYHQRNVVEEFAMSREEFCEFLEKIFLEIINHIHLTEVEKDGQKYHLFYSVCNGQPSGNPGTAFVNSAQGLWMMIRAWLEITAGSSYSTIERFFEHVYLVDYGDDVALNISSEAISFFNQNTLTRVMKKLFDIEFTDEKKTGDAIPDSRMLDEITFLKRGFRFEEDIQLYVSPMDEHVLLDILNWVRTGSEDARVITINNISSVAAELALVSEACFERWIHKLKKVYAELAWRVDKHIYFDTRHGYLLAFRNSQFKSVEAM